MELKDTVSMMNSDDYRERFKAEYYQLKCRHRKLSQVIKDYESGSLDFEPKCSFGLLYYQLSIMIKYMYLLEARSEIEGINLEEI